jgi:hypothetical protein
MSEQSQEIIDNLIAVKGEAYYQCVVFGVTVHQLALVLRQVGSPPEQRARVLEVLGLMWQQATAGSGFDTTDERFTNDLLADVMGVLKATRK